VRNGWEITTDEPVRTSRWDLDPSRGLPRANRHPSRAHNGEVSESRTNESTTEVRLRRAPRLPVFLLLGAIFGAIVTLIITSLSDADPKVGFVASYGYFCLYGVPAGIVLGAVVGLLLDRRSVRRARTVAAELERVEQPEAPEG